MTNDDLLLLGFACDALDKDPSAALRMPRNAAKTDKQYVAVEKRLLRELIATCPPRPTGDSLRDRVKKRLAELEVIKPQEDREEWIERKGWREALKWVLEQPE